MHRDGLRSGIVVQNDPVTNLWDRLARIDALPCGTEGFVALECAAVDDVAGHCTIDIKRSIDLSGWECTGNSRGSQQNVLQSTDVAVLSGLLRRKAPIERLRAAVVHIGGLNDHNAAGFKFLGNALGEVHVNELIHFALKPRHFGKAGVVWQEEQRAA